MRDARLGVEDVAKRHGEGQVGAVELVVVLSHRPLRTRADLQGAGEGLLQVLKLGGGEHQRAVLAGGVAVGGVGVGLSHEAEALLHVGQGVGEGHLGALGGVVGHHVGVELGVRHGLMREVGKEGVVVGGLVADGQAARLVVGGDENQGLVGVLVVEIDGGLHGGVQGEHVVDGGRGVVGVAGPVNLTSLGHHEEGLLVAQALDALLHVVHKAPLALGGVELVVHRAAVGDGLGDDEHVARGGVEGLGVGLRGGHGVARSGGKLVEVGLVLVLVCGRQPRAAGEVLKARLAHLSADGVVVLAAVLVGVEGGGGSVVHVDRGEHAHLVALLGVQLLGDGLEGLALGLGVHVDDAGVGLVARGDGGGGGGGVGAERRGVVGGHAARVGEAHEGERAGHHGAVVLSGALEEAGDLHLLVAHAVADEQEDVLGCGDRGGVIGKGAGCAHCQASACGKRSGLDEVATVHCEIHVSLSSFVRSGPSAAPCDPCPWVRDT